MAWSPQDKGAGQLSPVVTVTSVITKKVKKVCSDSLSVDAEF